MSKLTIPESRQMTDPRCPIHGTVFVNGTSASCTCPPISVSADRPASEFKTYCAHIGVSWPTSRDDAGLTTGWWECDSGCGCKFYPRIMPAADRPEYLFNKWHRASGFVAPFTPDGGNNDGVVRDARGRAVADCFGCEACADTVAASLNMAFSPTDRPENHPEVERAIDANRARSTLNSGELYDAFAHMVRHGELPRPVETSELREALDDLAAYLLEGHRSTSSPSDRVVAARSRIEELFASLQRTALFWIEAHGLRMKDIEKDGAEISRLRADQLSPEMATNLLSLISRGWLVEEAAVLRRISEGTSKVYGNSGAPDMPANLWEKPND